VTDSIHYYNKFSFKQHNSRHETIMHITVKREELLKPLGIVAGVVERRQTLPILSNILLRYNGKELTLTGTDLEVEISARFPCSGGDSGEMTLPARKLYDICRALPNEAQIDIKLEKEKALIKSGKSRFRLLTLPATEFPAIETAQWDTTLSLAQSKLRWLLDKTMFCMAQQDVRYYLNGLLFEVGAKKLRAVATDGHRLSLAEVDVSDSINGEKNVILPRKGVLEMLRFLDDSDTEVQLQIGANHLRVTLKGLTFTSKLIDGRFPDYNRVIPEAQNKQLKILRAPFRETLNRAAILSNEKYRGVRFGLGKNLMTITAHNPEQEEAQEEVAIDYSGEDMEIGFNVNYISEAVGALDNDEIEFCLNDPNSSCLLRVPGNNKHLYVVMPMRL
jgi:DNA polymerase-3 subunit beta